METTASAIRNHERQIGVAQQNIVNANDANYIKQEVNLVSNPQVGAEIKSIDLAMSEGLLKEQYNKNSAFHSSRVSKELLQQVIEDVYSLKLDGKNSITVNLNGIFGNIKELELASNHSNKMNDAVSSMEKFAENVFQQSEKLQKFRQEQDEQIFKSVEKLNGHIVTARNLSQTLPLLKGDNSRGSDVKYNDAKNKLFNEIREISKLIDVNQYFDKDGELVLETKLGIPLIKGYIKYKVEFTHTDGLDNYLRKDFVFPALSVVDEDIHDNSPQFRNDLVTSGVIDEITHHLKGGELQARFELRDKIIPDIINRLDIYTDTLVREMNAVYADATPEFGFQSVTSNKKSISSDPITVSGKFRIGLFNTDNGSSIKNAAGNPETIEIDLSSGISTLQNLIDKINSASSSGGYSVLAGLDSDGHLTIEPNNTANPRSVNFAIINENSKFGADGGGINQFFGFNDLKLFTYVDDKYYDSRTSANSAISIKVSDKISMSRQIYTAKVRKDGDIGTNNKAALEELLKIQNKEFNFKGTDSIAKSTATFSSYANGIVDTLNIKHQYLEEKVAKNKIELEAIDEQIASKSGVNTDQELLYITQLDRMHKYVLKTFQIMEEYWKTLLATF
jgi:flagellar hook-associated protein 1 FlgK